MAVALALAVALAAAGCGAAPKRGETLIDSVRSYNEGVRWSRFPVAASQVPPREREDFIDERDVLAEDLRISDYEITKLRDSGDRAIVSVKYTWYLDSVGTVHTTHANQSWERHGKAWLIIEERRSRGEPMPGLAEPRPKAEDPADPADPADGDEAGPAGADGAEAADSERR